MTITKQDIIDLETTFHETVMIEKGDAASQAQYFLYPEPMIILLRGEDISMQKNYEIHQKLVDERHLAEDDMLLTQLCDQPEKARAVFTVYWQGRLKDNDDPDATIKCYVGEDWIVQRNAGGVLKFVQYINTFHQFLPDSAAIDL